MFRPGAQKFLGASCRLWPSLQLVLSAQGSAAAIGARHLSALAPLVRTSRPPATDWNAPLSSPAWHKPELVKSGPGHRGLISPVVLAPSRPLSTSSAQRYACDPEPDNPHRPCAPSSLAQQPYLRALFPLSINELFAANFYYRAEFPPKRMDLPAVKILESCMEADYAGFMKVCYSQDKMEFWFAVTHMHTWFFARRIHREGRIGYRYGYERLWKWYWEVMESRVVELKTEHKRFMRGNQKKYLKEMHNRHLAFTLMYERAVQMPDQHLAKVLARILFENEELIDPTSLMVLVHYWRQQLAAVDNLPVEEIFVQPTYKFPKLIEQDDSPVGQPMDSQSE